MTDNPAATALVRAFMAPLDVGLDRLERDYREWRAKIGGQEMSNNLPAGVSVTKEAGLLACPKCGGRWCSVDRCLPTARTPEASKQVDALRAAASAVLAHRVGDIPDQGWLRDNDASRAALAQLAATLAEEGGK